MGDAERFAKVGDHARFGSAVLAKSMIDGRRFDLAGARGRRQEEQRKAIGTAGNRQAETGARPDQRVEIVPEAIEDGGFEGQTNPFGLS